MNMTNMFGGPERNKSQHLRFEEFVPSSALTEDSDSFCLIIDLPEFEREQVKLQVDKYGHIVASGERQVNEYNHIRFEQSYKVPENSDIEDTTAKFEDEILYITIPKKIKAEKEPHHEITNIPEAAAVQEEKETRPNAGDKVPETVSEEEVKGKDQESKNDNDNNGNEETSEEEKEKRGDNEETATTEEEFHHAEMEKQRNESSLVEKIGKELKKNKGVFLVAVIAFSLGVLFSQKLQANENNITS